MERTQDLNKAVTALREGGVIAHPADTCFGLAANLMNADAIRKLQRLKGRDANKPMSLMLPPSMQGQIEQYAQLDDYSRRVCERLLPGPVTIVLPRGPKVPKTFFPELDTVGLRVPDDEAVNQLLEAFGSPIVTTSANLSGEAPCYESYALKVDADLVIEGSVSDPKPPSTVVRPARGHVEILREGPITLEEIEALLK